MSAKGFGCRCSVGFFVSTAFESHHEYRELVPLDILTSWGGWVGLGWLVLEVPTFFWGGVAMTNGCQCLKKTSRKRTFFCASQSELKKLVHEPFLHS